MISKMAVQLKNGLLIKHLQILCRSFSVKMAMAEPTFSEITSNLADQQPTIKLRDVKYLAGSSSPNFPETVPKEVNKNFVGLKLDNPTCGNMETIGKGLRPILDSYLERDFAGILIKDLPISEVVDFQGLVRHLNYPDMTYAAGTAFRERVEKTVYSASDEPPEFAIEPHNEMSYIENFPTKIFFCCIKPADIGGENGIAFNREILKQLDPNIRENFRKRGIRYKRSIKHKDNSKYLTWQTMFDVDSVQEAEEVMTAQGMNWEWKVNGDLVLWNNLPVFRTHPRTGEEIWFNQATANHCTYYKSHPMYEHQQDLEPTEYPFHCCYGDNTEIEEEVLDHIRSINWKSAMSLKLAAGDVLLLDNMLCQHSRTGFKGSRKMVVQLADSIENYC